jgi:DNA-binding NarL/FixJ family response regulator
MSIRIVVIDGHTLTRYGLSCLVMGHSDLELVAEAENAAEAKRVVMISRPDVVIIDPSLPDGDGLQLVRELRDRHPSLGIVVLSSHQDDDVLFRALDCAASAFVGKGAPASEVLGAVRHAAVTPTSFTATGLAAALAHRREAGARFALSPREREVLSLLRDGLSIPDIARDLFVSQSTAKTYVARLYEKLGVTSRAQALMAALQHGLIRLDTPKPVAV